MKMPEQKPEKEIEPGGLKTFREILRAAGWMTSEDGEDFCRNCWEKYLGKFDPDLREQIKAGARPTAELAEYGKRSPEGWFVMCRGEPEFECREEISVPYAND